MAVETHNQTFKHWHSPDFDDIGENSLVEAVLAYRDLTGHWPAEIVINSKFLPVPGQVQKVRDPIGLDAMTQMTKGAVRIVYQEKPLTWEILMLGEAA